MAQASRDVIFRELTDVVQVNDDPGLHALRVAIYLEEALGITIPAAALTPEVLGSADRIGRILDDLTQEA